MTELIERDISKENWRSYDFEGRDNYVISNPKKVWFRVGGETHRVLDDNGVVHLVPAPGVRGCVVTWEPSDPDSPCNW